MRRAVVISVLLHLLMLVSLLELRLLPAGTLQKASGSLPLYVRFESTDEIGKRNMVFRNAAMRDDKPPERQLLTQMTTAASYVVVPAHGERPTRKAGDDVRSPLSAELAESVAPLPADLEREYRINLAREARRTHRYSVELMAAGHEGIVRMAISYWSRSGRPNVTLEQSSGYRDLDQDALKTVALAIGKVPLPAGVQGANFRMRYALEYRLAD